MLGFMVLLFLFASLTSLKDKTLKIAGYILIYTTVAITCISSILLVSSVFFDKPKPITEYSIFEKDKVDNSLEKKDKTIDSIETNDKSDKIVALDKETIQNKTVKTVTSDIPLEDKIIEISKAKKNIKNWKDKYSKIEDFRNGLAKVEKIDLIVKDGNKYSKYTYGIVNVDGKEIIECKYDEIKYSSILSTLFVKKDNLWGIIDKYGGQITQIVFGDISGPFEGFYNFQSYRNGAGFLRLDGMELTSGYGECRNFKEGMAAVSSRNTGQWGFINNKGELAIGYHYEKVDDFTNEGVAHVFYTPKYEVKQTARWVKKNGAYSW